MLQVPQKNIVIWILPYFLKDFIYLFLERGEGRENERERNISVWLPLMWPPLGTWPTTQACALTGNWTSNPLVCRPMSSHWATPARVHSWTLPCLEEKSVVLLAHDGHWEHPYPILSLLRVVSDGAEGRRVTIMLTLDTYSVTDSVLKTLCALSHLTVNTNPWR